MERSSKTKMAKRTSSAASLEKEKKSPDCLSLMSNILLRLPSPVPFWENRHNLLTVFESLAPHPCIMKQ